MCCNPEHLEIGTDKENANDERKKYQYEAWGESKTLEEWIKDDRVHAELINEGTLFSRLNKKCFDSNEEAFTTPLLKVKGEDRSKKKQRQIKNLIEAIKDREKKCKDAYLIRLLYNQGESYQDMAEYFGYSYSMTQNMAKGKAWNSNIEYNLCVPQDYIRKTNGKYCYTPYKKIEWVNGLWFACAVFDDLTYDNRGFFDTDIEAAKAINQAYIDKGLEPPNDIEGSGVTSRKK